MCLDKMILWSEFVLFFKRCFLPCFFGLSLLLPTALVFADDSLEETLYFGGDLGVAQIELHRGDVKKSDTWLYGALRAEYALYQELLVGVEGAGWTDQSKVNSAIYEDVFTLIMTARIYPSQGSSAFVKFGWGPAKHRYWESSTENDTSGKNYIVGFGIGPVSMLYSRGDLEQDTYKALTISGGFTF